MIDIRNNKCKFNECIKRPNFNYEGEKKSIYCFEHKKDDMIDVKSRRCINEHCNTFASKTKYRGYCFRCFMYIFPDEPISKYYKIKEKHVSDYITQQFPHISLILDNQIDGGCSRKRPDIFIECLTYSIIIEVDEDQHSDYSCENKRMMQLFKDLGDRPIIFIRFNPDKYIDKDGKSIKSCFKYHKTTGVPMIADENKWTQRLETLKEKIQYYLDNIPNKEVTIENLYYDS